MRKTHWKEAQTESASFGCIYFSTEAGVPSIESIRKSFTHVHCSLSSKKHTVKQVGDRHQTIYNYSMLSADIPAVP